MSRKVTSANKGFESLLGVHTQALEDNSKSVVEILEILSDKKLSARDKSALNKIKKEIKDIDKRLDKLGKEGDFTDEFRF